ncbi:MAG: VPLPA-CTERM sorting domain-containing protein [Gammaproteobacteria bacterium]
MTRNNVCKSSLTALALAATVAFAPASSASLRTYSQDFEDMTPNQGFPPNDLEADGWLIFGIAYETDPNLGPANIAYSYGPFEAANGDPGSIQGVATGEGGDAQGNVVLNKYTDYNNPDQTVVPFTPGMPKYYISASTFQTQTTSTSNIDDVWRFAYDAKIGNLEADSSAFAYVQLLDSAGNDKAFVTNDSTNLPDTWGRYFLDLDLSQYGAVSGDTVNFGFVATSTDYNGSAVFYDNLEFFQAEVEVIPVPAAVWLFGSGLVGLVGVARRRKH